MKFSFTKNLRLGEEVGVEGGRTSLIYDHFDLYLTPATLTFNLPKKMFQMALLILEATTVQNYSEIHA